MIDFKEALSNIVVGQDDAVDRVADALDVAVAKFTPDDRPRSVILMLGPTGTGKTRLVEAVAEVLHDDRKKLVRIDCAEFQQAHDVAKIIGAPPGYLGHRETAPRLTQAKLSSVESAAHPITVVLFDEIEKAHRDFHQMLLGVLDKATLTTGDSNKVDLSKSVIFMTSNVGAKEFALEAAGGGLGFRVPTRDRSTERSLEIGLGSLKKKFSPEFLNRIDEVIVFKNLTRRDVAEIFDREFAALQRLFADRSAADERFAVTMSPKARAKIVEEGFSPALGARELKRVLHRRLTVPLSRLKSSGGLFGGAVAHLNDDLELTVSKGSLATLIEASVRMAPARKRQGLK
jgi:ATP-dependent Clp protease ATP-binding subunit ClpA